MNVSVMFNVKSKTKNDCFKYVWIKSSWTIITIYLFLVLKIPDYLKNIITMVCEPNKHSRKIVKIKWFQFVDKFFFFLFVFSTEKASSQVKVLWYRTSTQSCRGKAWRVKMQRKVLGALLCHVEFILFVIKTRWKPTEIYEVWQIILEC